MNDIGTNTFEYRKSTQAINYFVRKFPDFNLSKMKSLKLLWAADRYHLRKYGRPVVGGDTYVAMPYGPVPSTTKDLLEGNSYYLGDMVDYNEKFLKINGRNIESIANVDEKVFSNTDIESLTFAIQNFGGKNIWELCELTHVYPEWKKYEKEITSKKSRVESMDFLDFFSNPQLPNDPFTLDSLILEGSKEVYLENCQIDKILNQNTQT